MRRAERARIRGIAVITAAVVIVAGPWTLISAASWSRSRTVSSNTFSTGSVDLTTTPTSKLFQMSGMSPGARSAAWTSVKNTGTLDLRYAISLATSGTRQLTDAMDLTIMALGPSCDFCKMPACDQDVCPNLSSSIETCTNSGGSILYNGTMSQGVKVGDPAPGAQSGDRTLARAATEYLCFEVQLPGTAGTSMQGMSATASFDFPAEQTDNNP